MMKAKDCSVATALVIHGYLRANDGAVIKPGDEDRHLADCLNAIRQEVADWAENLPLPDGLDDCALEPESMAVGATIIGGGLLNRTPYNLVSVAIAALREAVDLAGPGTVLADFGHRGGIPAAAPKVKEPTNADESSLLIEEANKIAAEIDEAVERPVAKLATWGAIVEALRRRGVEVEEHVTAPANW